MGVVFRYDDGDKQRRGCFANILRGLESGGVWDDEEKERFVPDTITFYYAAKTTVMAAARSSVEEWDKLYEDLYQTMEGVSYILSLAEMQAAGRERDVTMTVADQFTSAGRTFLPMVLHLVRLPYTAPWVARMYKQIKERWPDLGAVDCFQLACAVRPALPDDKDETSLLRWHPVVHGSNRDANRPFNALTDIRLGQDKMRPCPATESFSVTQFSVRGGSTKTRNAKLRSTGAKRAGNHWETWAMQVIRPKLTPDEYAEAERDAARSWGGQVRHYMLKRYFGQELGYFADGNFSLTCEEIIELIIAIFGGKKK